MGATATSGYRCRCGIDELSFALTMIAQKDVGELPEFKLQLPVAVSASSSGVAEATLRGYVARNSLRNFWPGLNPDRFYRLVYGRGKYGSGATLPPGSVQHHGDGNVAARQEERRLMATEEGRQRCGLRL